MRRKFAMIAAFVVAISGAIATKASPKTTYKTFACVNTAICGATGVNCGYDAMICPRGTLFQKTAIQ